MLALLAERDRRHLPGRKSRCETEVFAHLWLQLIKQVCASGHRESIRKLARDRGSADGVVGLEQQHVLAGFREQRRAHQAVVATANDNGIESVSHRRSSPVPCSPGADPPVSHAPR